MKRSIVAAAACVCAFAAFADAKQAARVTAIA